MTAPQNFRSAFNGFNREDVVNHISFMTSKHETQVRELRAEADALRDELETLRAAAQEKAGQEEQIPALEKEVEKTAEELFRTRQELQAANQLLNEQEEEIAKLRAELEKAKAEAAAPAAPAAPVEPMSHWDELKAYRRAENVERQAHERVNQLYDSATEALRNAGKDLAAATDTFDTLAEKFRADLVALMENIDAGRNSLSAAADTLDGLRPEDIQ